MQHLSPRHFNNVLVDLLQADSQELEAEVYLFVSSWRAILGCSKTRNPNASSILICHVEKVCGTDTLSVVAKLICVADAMQTHLISLSISAIDS